ncbi:hypothetical protein [Streptomyces coeruleorubidus]|uniref:hypothetical protein n=1 Tax=Streptomyces coeruleorubidus TaxID=116188 RepID=UPI00340CC439
MTTRSENEPEKNEKPRTVSIPGRLEYPEGLTPGKTEKGGLHPNLYDSQGGLTSHADFFPDTENEAAGRECRPTPRKKGCDEFTEAIRDEIRDAILYLLGRAIDRAVVAAESRIERWWDDQALPAIKSRLNKTLQRNRPAENRETDSQSSIVEASTVIEATVVDSSPEEISVLDGNKARMSSAEARMRLLLALMARAFSEEQVRVVSNAIIEDDDFAELKRAVDELTPQQIANIIQTLEVNPLFLSDETWTELEKTLGRNEKINEVLRLTNSENQLRSADEQ